MFMVIDKISGASIGTAKISNIDNVNGICNIGLMIGNRNFWGAGIGKESLSLLIDYAFKDLNIRKISDAIQSNNSRSLAANLKLGFSVEGVLKEQIWHEGEQKYLDKILIGLFAKDWKGK
jgi:RimJ/RimL family protein N-acetyltransferase